MVGEIDDETLELRLMSPAELRTEVSGLRAKLRNVRSALDNLIRSIEANYVLVLPVFAVGLCGGLHLKLGAQLRCSHTVLRAARGHGGGSRQGPGGQVKRRRSTARSTLT